MRGIAILAIMLHNYCHFNGKIVQENEYQFLDFNNARLWQVLSNPTELLPVHLLSFFGHYGVPVFLFLSGFGLVKKYETSSTCQANSARFLRYHYLKLFRMLIVGFSIFLVVDAVTPGRFAFHWQNVIAQLLMYINILPEPEKIIWPGIYWFFGLMLQLYIVYRLLFCRRSSWVVVGLIVVCWLLQVFCEPDGEVLNRLRYNCIGGMLPFGLGIMAGRVPLWHETFLPHKIGWLVVFILASLLVFVMGFSFQSWLWIPVFIVIGCVAVVKAMPEWLLKGFVWFGGISAAMFVAHPIVRKLFITVAWKQDIYDGLMLYVVVTIALSWAVKQIIDRIPSPKL
ncbi:MAG: acyltransferase family protein [Prevotella sp.]|nr:acyltransferase family protein [Prevotella sp.]